MFNKIVNKLKDVFSGEKTTSEQHIQVTIPANQNANVEIKYIVPHQLDEWIDKPNISVHSELKNVLMEVRDTSQKLQSHIDKISDLSQRSERSREAERIVNNLINSLANFDSLDMIVATTKIMPDTNKTAVVSILENCYAANNSLLNLRNQTQSVSAIAFANSLQVNNNDVDFAELEPNGLDGYIKKISNKPINMIQSSGMLANILSIGINTKKAALKLIDVVVSDAENEKIEKALAQLNLYKHSLEINDISQQTTAAYYIFEQLPVIKSTFEKLTNLKKENEKWIEICQQNIKDLQSFEQFIKGNQNYSTLFENYWTNFHSNLFTLEQINVNLMKQIIILEQKLTIINNILSVEDKIKSIVLGK